jgi:NTP pyrophosphatase (non-canonical NTP hydrolase)
LVVLAQDELGNSTHAKYCNMNLSVDVISPNFHVFSATSSIPSIHRFNVGVEHCTIPASMADPLSVAGSIAGLVSLADTVFRMSFKYYKAVKGAKGELEELISEMRNLAGILHCLSLLALSLEDEQFDPTLKMHHINSCRHTLMQIDKRLSKAKNDFESPSKLDVVQRRIKWLFSTAETKELLEEITRHKETVSLALSADSMNAMLRCLSRQDDIGDRVANIQQAVAKNLEISTRIQVDSSRERVLYFFMMTNPQSNLEMSLKLRHPLTGLWLTDGPTFTHWLEVPNSKLWLSGIPGAGKTVLAGAMIEETLRLADESIAVAFFFCDYKNKQTHSAVNILGSLASQIARQKEKAYDSLANYYNELHPEKHLAKSLGIIGLQDALQGMMEELDKVFIIIDGLDECADNTDDVLEILMSLVNSQEKVSLALLSRDEQNIREKLEDEFTHVPIAAHTEDLQLFVAAEIENRIKSNKLRIRNPNLKDEIIQTLIKGAHGM